MGKKRTLKLRGSLRGADRLTPCLKRVKEYLDALPVDEARSTEAIAVELGFSIEYLQSTLKRLGEKYRYKEGTSYGYGNPETVKLKKEGFYEIQEKPEDG